jgi:hypothetical protein
MAMTGNKMMLMLMQGLRAWLVVEQIITTVLQAGLQRYSSSRLGGENTC